MNRRAFLTTLAAGLAAPIDPERLLWTPGKKLISIPKTVAAIPPCPFLVFCAAGRGNEALALLGVLRRRWNTEAEFRARADAAMESRLMLTYSASDLAALGVNGNPSMLVARFDGIERLERQMSEQFRHLVQSRPKSVVQRCF